MDDPNDKTLVEWLKAESQIALEDGCPVASGYLRDGAERIEDLTSKLAAETAIVDRIWDQFGRPDYDDLKGRSIHDLIQETIDSNARHVLKLDKRERECQQWVESYETADRERDELLRRLDSEQQRCQEYKRIADRAEVEKQDLLDKLDACEAERVHEKAYIEGYAEALVKELETQRDEALRRLDSERSGLKDSATVWVNMLRGEIAVPQAITHALERADEALHAWLHTFADELCEPSQVEIAYQRINQGGGTLAYIAGVVQDIRSVKAAAVERQGPESTG